MSDNLQHECGIAMLRLLKPLDYYKEKYGTPFYAINKMYLMLEKQHNRGQDGAGLASIKLDMQPGERYINRVRSNKPQPIQDIFKQINTKIQDILKENPNIINDTQTQKQLLPYIGEIFLGHNRYGTFGKNNIEYVHPFLRQNNWMYRNLIIAGNFNMTNSKELFDRLVELGQHPKELTDAVTIMERIGHFLDTEVENLYQNLKAQGVSKKEAAKRISEELNVTKILKKSASKWDGGYTMAGIIGHGDSFVIRDPAGIRPAYYYQDEEMVVVTSERPVIQTAFNLDFEQITELPPGSAIIIKKNGNVSIEEIVPPLPYKACSFERIYFSRGSDKDIYQERKKLGALLLPKVLKSVDENLENTVFAYIPNTAETSFYGLVEEAQRYLNHQKKKLILESINDISEEKLEQILSLTPRIEKVAIKDTKLRTFITEDSSRNDMVAYVYDITYGSVKKDVDTLVIIDDSIVRGTTLRNSILKILNRLNPKKIIVLSSAPQVRYPDCYGIDMPRLEDLTAFDAALELHKERNTYHIIQEVYEKCKTQIDLQDAEVINYVKEIYEPFSDEEISKKIAELLIPEEMDCPVEIIFQSVENLHLACPKNMGDWYFTGDYPTAGGNRIVNRAYINFFENKK